MFEPLLIHNDNTKILDKIKNRLSLKLDEFDFEKSDLDTYITNEIIPILQQKQFNILFIKDNLSQNYVELYGILLSYHIRLSSELEDKRFVPIIILSDVDGYILNKLTPMANVLFTKNTFVARNEILSYDYFEKVFEQIQPFSDFKKEFLDLIHIDPPQDYLSHHDISNEWSIYRWARFLKVDTDATKTNKVKIENMLYFKYLKAKFPIAKKTGLSIVPKTPQNEGNILYIDDEWDKGWKDIFEKYFSKSKNINFHFIDHQYKDTSYNTIETLVNEYLNSNSIDTILLDMRLTKEDHKQKKVNELSGIKLLKLIKSFNPGIQVILLTASEKSTILDEANKYNILGYIKKESPSDDGAYTEEVFEKLKTLIDLGFTKKHLQEIWTINQEIQKILNNNFFTKYIADKEQYKTNLGKLNRENEHIFDILNSDKDNRFNYAMVSVATSLEAIVSILFKVKKNELFFWDNEKSYLNERSRLEDKINKIIKKLGYENNIDLSILIQERNNYMHSNEQYRIVTECNILEWFKDLAKIIQIINTPPNYIKYDEKNLKVEENITTKSGLKIRKRTRAI